MCGIFGSRDFQTYEKLYINNKRRGTFAGGSIYAKPSGDLYLKKWEGVSDVDEMTGEYAWVSEYDTYVGHTQAPTSSTRTYSDKTTHPFEHGWWIVAHNGVLENDQYIRKEFLQESYGECSGSMFDTSTLPVDSAVIPALIDTLYVGSDLLAIKESLENLKGTFACWIYSKRTYQTYIARSGSTLFGDVDNSVFSSVKIPGLANDELEEGVIYCMTKEGLTNVGTFNHSSPFFML
jgi:glucosamine 6-phosphate synthetase-like amidotransferase/phosphosugar isomerase protein